MSHLISVVRPQVEGSTATLSESSLPELPRDAVLCVLLRLTASHLLTQSDKVLGHLDILDVTQFVVPLSL